MWSTLQSNCVIFTFVLFPFTINLISDKSNFIILPHSISTQKLVSVFSHASVAFSEIKSLTAHRLIRRKCWRRSLRGPCELQPPLPQSEKVLAHIPDIGPQSRPAGSLQPLAWACWGKISLSATENLLLRQPPVGRKNSVEKGRDPMLSSTSGLNHNATGNALFCWNRKKKEIGRAESRARPVSFRSCMQCVHCLNQIAEARG